MCSGLPYTYKDGETLYNQCSGECIVPQKNQQDARRKKTAGMKKAFTTAQHLARDVREGMQQATSGKLEALATLKKLYTEAIDASEKLAAQIKAGGAAAAFHEKSKQKPIIRPGQSSSEEIDPQLFERGKPAASKASPLVKLNRRAQTLKTKVAEAWEKLSGESIETLRLEALAARDSNTSKDYEYQDKLTPEEQKAIRATHDGGKPYEYMEQLPPETQLKLRAKRAEVEATHASTKLKEIQSELNGIELDADQYSVLKSESLEHQGKPHGEAVSDSDRRSVDSPFDTYRSSSSDYDGFGGASSSDYDGFEGEPEEDGPASSHQAPR